MFKLYRNSLFISFLFLGCFLLPPDDDSTEKNIEVGEYNKLFTICYTLPENSSDDVGGNASFSLTANSSSSNFFSGLNLSTRNESTEAIDFNISLRQLENKVLSRTLTSRSTSVKRNSTSPAQVNDTRNFYVRRGEADIQINAKCVAVTKGVAFFQDVETETPLTTEQINVLKKVVQEKFPIVRDKFATEIDTDGNGQVFFLFSELSKSIAGYFYSADKYTQEQLTQYGFTDKTNECDILYINESFLNEMMTIEATMVHEFQHMVLFDYRIQERLGVIATWLNEGLSMLCEYLCGYGEEHAYYTEKFFMDENVISLIEHPSSIAHYGYVLLFTRYLQERFGDEFIKKLYNSEKTGVFAVCEAVNVSDFNNLFSDFMKMFITTGQGVSKDKRYEIENFNYKPNTSGYKINGFCIPQLMEVFSCDLGKYNKATVSNMKNYSFVPIYWVNGRVTSFSGKFNNVKLLVGAY